VAQDTQPGGPLGDEPRCLVGRDVLNRVGDKWSAHTIALLGGGTMRFSELRRGIDGISQRMLTVTLRALERDGLIDRQVYPVIPPRVEYSLTPLGRSLLVAVRGLIEWSEANTDAVQQARERYDAAAERADGDAPLTAYSTRTKTA
jgi:DNA-binding HxlR family transcriptional regulator